MWKGLKLIQYEKKFIIPLLGYLMTFIYFFRNLFLFL